MSVVSLFVSFLSKKKKTYDRKKIQKKKKEKKTKRTKTNKTNKTKSVFFQKSILYVRNTTKNKKYGTKANLLHVIFFLFQCASRLWNALCMSADKPSLDRIVYPNRNAHVNGLNLYIFT